MAIFKINGKDVVPSPIELQLDIYDITDGERNASATMVIQLVAKKRKVIPKWGTLTQNQLRNLLAMFENDLYFNITYIDLDGIEKTIRCYKGDRSASMYTWNNGSPIWESFSVNFIEA